MLQHPFQCIAVVKPPQASEASNSFLLAACGPQLVSTSLGEEATVFEWTADAQPNDKGTKDDERPAKKQKTNAPASASSSIIKLSVSPDNRHAVTVTEDKIVHVFRVHGDGTLQELSQRAMPKRPCATQVLPDNATILCGDKFGDVYSLPLLPEETVIDAGAVAGSDAIPAESKATEFKPSASKTTVHTKRNRKALEAQLKQKNLTAKTKEPLKFEHNLLLGHVSMLTDLAYATRIVDGKQRRYIITADRDEHIRVSRGPPQSHVIEGYCLGHKDFVSKICLFPSADMLVSGGGDDWVGVWKWPSFELANKIDVLGALKTSIHDSGDGSGQTLDSLENIAVSGMWMMPMRVNHAELRGARSIDVALVVACEGINAILVCPIWYLFEKTSRFKVFTSFDGPILDMAAFEDTIIVSMDDRKEQQPRVKSFRLEIDLQNDSLRLLEEHSLSSTMQQLNDNVAADAPSDKQLDTLLYGVANLRKRGYQNDEQGAEDGAAPED